MAQPLIDIIILLFYIWHITSSFENHLNLEIDWNAAQYSVEYPNNRQYLKPDK